MNWYTHGANPDEIENQKLHEDLHSLRIGRKIKHILTGVELEPTKYILLDEPFGKSRYRKNKLIDLSIHLRTPLEISLARRILRQLSNPNESLEKQNHSIRNYLNTYLNSHIRNLYTAVDSLALNECDISLDGSKSADELVSEVLNLLSWKNGGDLNSNSSY